MSAAIRTGQTRNLHVPLSEELHRQIVEESARSGRPATAIVRAAVEEYLHALRRAAVHEELAAYAQRWAGSPVDLDEGLEAAAVKQLRGRGRARR